MKVRACFFFTIQSRSERASRSFAHRFARSALALSIHGLAHPLCSLLRGTVEIPDAFNAIHGNDRDRGRD